jgi:hypothetical protein
MGDSATYDGMQITINSYDFKTSYCGVTTSSGSDTILCVVNVTVKNTTSSKISLKESSLLSSNDKYLYTLVYNEDYKYNQTYASYTDFLATYESISPLETITASLCYKVPKEVQTSTTNSLKIKFSLNKTKATEFHYWTLR